MELKDIKFDKRNYRKHNDKNKELIKKSVTECGFGRSIVIDSDNEIIGGNGVVGTLDKDTKIKVIETDGSELVVVKRTDLKTEDEKRKRLAVLDNSTSDSSEFDLGLLQEDFDVGELGDLGIDLPEVETDEEEHEIVEDEVPEQVETRCKRGDVWKLGNHRLMCGDSTSIDDVEKLMNGEKADLCFTDPPYGMKKEIDGVLNDNLNYDALLDFNRQWIPLTFMSLKDVGSWYCWGIDEPLMDIYSNILKPMAKDNKITFRNLITWDKGSGQGQMLDGYRMYAPVDEKCLFVMCGVQGFNNNADNYFEGWEPIRTYLNDEMNKCGGSKNWDKALGNQMGKHFFTKSQWAFPTKENYEKLQAFAKGEAFKREYEDIKREYYETRAYFDNTHDNMNNVWHFERTSSKEREQTGGHATPKPIALCSRAIKTSSREGELVIDFFGGSGSTLIACEQLNRKCYMLELDEHYCDVIITRWETLTGKKAELI
jgi:DNA modification methylase